MELQNLYMVMNDKQSILVSEINCGQEIRYKLVTDGAEAFAEALSTIMKIVYGIGHQFDVQNLFEHVNKASSQLQICMLQIVGQPNEIDQRHVYMIVECRPMFMNTIALIEEYEVRPRYHFNYVISAKDDKPFDDDRLHVLSSCKFM